MSDVLSGLRGSLPKWAFILFGPLFLIGMIAWWMQRADEERGRQWFLGQLGGLSKGARVTLNGEPISNSAPVLVALARVEHVGSHHSHPTDPIRVEVAAEKARLSLVLARDSEKPTEYWVFLPAQGGSGGSLGREIGRINTSAFDRQILSVP